MTHTERGTPARGFREQGAEEDIWAQKGWGNKGVKKTA
jgi:hypothetical protein